MPAKINLNVKLSPHDMWSVIHQELEENKFSSHSLNSMNDFYTVGLNQIMTEVFDISNTMDNVRDKTPQDKLIKKIRYKVIFDNIRLKSPVTAGYKSGKEKVLTPIQAHTDDRTYLSNLIVNAHIQAWAYHHDGAVVHREAKTENYLLSGVPTMVGSILCNLYNKSADAIKQWNGDSREAYGYFIKNGKEWIIDNVESTAFNQPRIFKNAWNKETLRLEFISKPGDSYQNSKQVIIRLMNNGSITIEIATGSIRGIQFPFFLIFRALGWYTDKEMFDNILYRNTGYPNSSDQTDRMPASDSAQDVLFRKMADIIETAMAANYDMKTHKFGNSQTIHGQAEVLAFLIRHMGKEVFRDLDMAKEEHIQQATNKLLNHFDIDLLPHIGLDETSRITKLRFLGHFINRILYVIIGLLPVTDRDSYETKRIHTVGISFGKAFKTHYNASIVNSIRKQFSKDFKAMSFTSVNLTQTLTLAVNGADFERLLMQSITSATQTTLKVNKYRTVVNRLSSQLLDRKNYTKIYSTIRMVISMGGDSSKSSDRAKQMRMPHPSFHGFICFIQSAEGGEKVGLHKQLGISASVTAYGSSEFLKQFLLDDTTHCIPQGKVAAYNVGIMSKIFVNGDWIACSQDSSALVTHYTNLRRELKIDDKTTIEWNDILNEVNFWVDYGRPCRPLVIVYNNQRDWKQLGLTGPATSANFRQGTALTQDILNQLQAGKLKMQDLQKLGVIEYVTPQEQSRLYVASDIKLLTLHEKNAIKAFTHVDIPETMLGIAALTCPFANYNQTTRNTFQTSQVRQSCAHYAYNWCYRVDKDTFLQYQVDNALVTTRIGDYIPPTGSEIIVAVACYTGYNEEDSVVMNKVMSERLKFNGCWFHYDKVELEKSEYFANPDVSRTTGIKNYANYSKLGPNGIVPIGTIVNNRDVVVGKIKQLPKNIAEEKKVDFQDQSLVFKLDFPVVVHNVILAKDDDATEFCKIAYRMPRSISVGDKFCVLPTSEVLTQDGWKKMNDITLDDYICTLEDGKFINYDKPSAVLRFPHNGPMYNINSSHIKMTCTLNHKMYVAMNRRKPTDFDFVEAKNVIGKLARYKKDGLYAARNVEHRVINHDGITTNYDMDAYLQLLGTFISDGHLNKNTSSDIIISCIKERKIEHLTQLCAKLNIEFKTRIAQQSECLTGSKYDNKIQHNTIKNKGIYNDLLPLNVGAMNKYLPEYALNLSQRQSRVLLDALIMGDGNRGENGRITFNTSSHRLANDVTQLALHAGYSAKVSLNREAGEAYTIGSRTGTRKADALKVNISRTCNTPLINAHKSKIKDYAKYEYLEDYVGDVMCVTVPTHVFYYRADQYSPPCWSANSARSGQKCVCALLSDQADMPFTASGIIPDIVINGHSFPKRMTMGQPLECIQSKICAKLGTFINGTAFTEVNLDDIIAKMTELGMDLYGRERLFCGITGNWMDSLIFMGPTFYQRLQKFVFRQVYSIDVGPTDIVTRQPLDGKANQGGLRISELQRDVLLAHGCSWFFSEKFFTDSDDFEIYICRCGSRAIVNHKQNIYECPRCKDDANIDAVYSSWSSKQMFMELNACHIGTQFKLAPLTFYEGL